MPRFPGAPSHVRHPIDGFRAVLDLLFKLGERVLELVYLAGEFFDGRISVGRSSRYCADAENNTMIGRNMERRINTSQVGGVPPSQVSQIMPIRTSYPELPNRFRSSPFGTHLAILLARADEAVQMSEYRT